jgi:hypothetical protein
MMTLVIIFFSLGGADSRAVLHVPAAQCEAMARIIIDNGEATGAFCQADVEDDK